jgi:hypothetical protein
MAERFLPRVGFMTEKKRKLAALSSIEVFPRNGYIELNGELKHYTPKIRHELMSSAYVKSVTMFYTPEWYLLCGNVNEEYMKGICGVTREVTSINIHDNFVVYGTGLWKMRFREINNSGRNRFYFETQNYMSSIGYDCSLVVLHYHPTYEQLVECIGEVIEEASGDNYEEGITKLVADYAFFKHKVKHISKEYEEQTNRHWSTYRDDEFYDRIANPYNFDADYFL